MEPNTSRLFSSLQVTTNKIKCTYLIEIAGHCVFVKDNAVQCLKQLHNQGVVEFLVTIPPEKQLCHRNVQ